MVVACSLTAPLPDLQPKLPLEICPLGQAGLRKVRAADRSPLGSKGLRPAAGTGAHRIIGPVSRSDDWLCLGLHRGQPVAGTRSIRRTITHGDVLCVDAYTTPAFRGKGVQTALALARFRLFGDLGYQRAIAYIERRNAPSLAVWRKLGGQEIGEIEFRRIGPWLACALLEVIRVTICRSWPLLRLHEFSTGRHILERLDAASTALSG